MIKKIITIITDYQDIIIYGQRAISYMLRAIVNLLAPRAYISIVNNSYYHIINKKERKGGILSLS